MFSKSSLTSKTSGASAYSTQTRFRPEAYTGMCVTQAAKVHVRRTSRIWPAELSPLAKEWKVRSSASTKKWTAHTTRAIKQHAIHGPGQNPWQRDISRPPSGCGPTPGRPHQPEAAEKSQTAQHSRRSRTAS